MRSNIVTISDLGVVSIPAAPIQMTISEIADLFDVLVPTVRARVNAILKSKSVTPHTAGNCTGNLLGNCNAPIFFDLEMVIAVAFSVDSYRANIFRRYILGRVTAVNVQPIYISVAKDNNIYN